MVRSKEVPKKPKDPLLTPPSKPRGFSFRDDGGFGGSLPRNRGGAAMSSPAPPASVPNYMRATSSSGAKAGQRQRAGAPSSASASTPTRQRRPVRVVTRGKVLFPAPAAVAAAPGMVRPTCSSTLKEAKFPCALDLAPGATDAEGPAAMRVCPYTYCSLNGHAHAPAVPLRSFLASRRRLIKTQQSMKHKGVSAFRRGTTGQQRSEDKNVVCAGAVAKVAPPLVDENALGDFFVEVYTGPRVSSEMSCSDMSLDEMDATVRRMEFVVFDRCGADDDTNEKGNDLGVHGDGEGRPEERLGVCRDSSSECSDAGLSGNLVEELPWMRYQGYECDSLDDDVSEEQGVIIHEEIGEAEVLAQGQEGEDDEGRSGGSGDEREEGADDEQKPEDEEIIPDLPREMGIVMEEEGVDCRVDTMYRQEASTGQETQHPGDDEECVSDVVDKMEIAAEQACVVCTVEVCKEQEEKDGENILGNVCQGDTSDGLGTSEEELSDGVCESEIPEVAEMVENVLEESCKEANSADQEAKDDETNMDSTGKLEVTEEQKDGEFGMEIPESVSDVACEEDFFEQEPTSEAVSKGEISDSSAIGSPDVEISNEPTDGGFEQDVSTVVEDAFEQYDGTRNNRFEQFDATAENTASGTKDAQKGLEITTCKSEDASEEPGIAQENSNDINSVSVDAPVQMEPENTEYKPANCSEESSIPEGSIQSDNSAHVNNSAQIEVCVDAPAQMEPEITECKLEDSSEESGIPEEISQSDKSAHVNNGAETESEFTTGKSEDPSKECGIVHDDNPAYLGEGAQMQLGNVTSELEDTSEECIAREIGEDDNSAYVSDDAQNDSEITTCELACASESVTVQEADQDHNCAGVGGGAENESELTPSELANASEGSGVIEEAGRDDNTADVNDGSQKESESMACGSEHAHKEMDITQGGEEDNYTAGALKETQITTGEGAQMQLGNVTSELEDTSEECIAREIGEDDNSAYVSDDAQNDSEITTCELACASESVTVQEADQDHNCAGVGGGAENESELTPSELANASEGSGVIEEAGRDDNTADVNDGSQKESESMACGSEHAHKEMDITQGGEEDNYTAGALKETQITTGEGAQMQLGNVTSELEDTSEECIAREIGEDDNSAYVSDDAQNDSEITTCELACASESVTVQEADQDHNCADVGGGAENESELTPSELANASEGSGVIEEAGRDDNTADVNDGSQKESESMACGSEHAHKEMDITQGGEEDNYTAGALKETQITTGKTKDACEEVCITEEANLSSTVQIPEQTCDVSATDGHGEPQNLTAVEDNDAKEFSIDDMCSVFSGMNLKGDVYVDPAESEISPRKRLIIAGRRRTPEEEEYMRGFNPRAPNFLPLELDPDSEKVDLRHQTAEDRKNAEEWMIDYALRRAVNNLGARKKKVELLVQAFETVLPHDGEDKKNTTPTRPVQACS